MPPWRFLINVIACVSAIIVARRRGRYRDIVESLGSLGENHNARQHQASTLTYWMQSSMNTSVRVLYPCNHVPKKFHEASLHYGNRPIRKDMTRLSYTALKQAVQPGILEHEISLSPLLAP